MHSLYNNESHQFKLGTTDREITLAERVTSQVPLIISVNLNMSALWIFTCFRTVYTGSNNIYLVLLFSFCLVSPPPVGLIESLKKTFICKDCKCRNVTLPLQKKTGVKCIAHASLCFRPFALRHLSFLHAVFYDALFKVHHEATVIPHN